MDFLRNIVSAVINFFFGCSHQHATFPFTIKHRTYRVCLDCGAEMPYSVQTWSYVPLRRRRAEQPAPAAPARTATILAFETPRTSREVRLSDAA